MKVYRASTLLLLAVAVLGLAAPASAADPGPATKAYVEFNAALEKATTLSDVLPYLSAQYRKMLESRPKADQPEWLKRLKETLVKDLKVTGETVSGNTATILATGTSSRGNAMKGKVTMVKEGGAWKLDEQGWST